MHEAPVIEDQATRLREIALHALSNSNGMNLLLFRLPAEKVVSEKVRLH